MSDNDLKRFIRDEAVAPSCSFCGRESRKSLIAADADELVEHIAACLSAEYEDAAEQVPYESREGGYQARTMDSEDLLYEEGLERINDEAFDYIAQNLPDLPWVQRDFFRLTPYDVLRSGWNSFADAVKHHTRYLFFTPRRSDSWDTEEIRPEHMLKALGHLIRGIGLVRTVKAGMTLVRVRVHAEGLHPASLAELGPPTSELARFSNRMSPAGISMLYTAEDADTAIAETVDAANGQVCLTIAQLRLMASIRVVDFVRLPRRPSIFTPNITRQERAALRFIHSFASDLSKPVKRDGMEHVGYVPTQVVTEYLRFRFRSRGAPVQGIRYSSARRSGGVNVAIFVGHEDLQPSPFGEASPIVLDLESAECRHM